MDISNTNRCGSHVHARRPHLKIKKLVTLNITCNFIPISSFANVYVPCTYSKTNNNVPIHTHFATFYRQCQ